MLKAYLSAKPFYLSTFVIMICGLSFLGGNVTHNYYVLGTTTKLSILFQVLGLWLPLERNVILRLRFNCD